MPVAPFYIQPYDYGPHAARMQALLQQRGQIAAQDALQRAQIGANVTQSLADLVGKTVLGIAQQREAEAQRQREEQRYQDLLTRQNRLLELQEQQATRQGELHAQQMQEVERARQLRELTGQLLAEPSIRVKGPQGVTTIDEQRVSEWLKTQGKEAFASDVLPTVRAFNQSVLTATSSRRALEQATLQGLGVLSRVVAAGGYTPEALDRAKDLAINAGLMTDEEYQQFIGQKVGRGQGPLTPQQIKSVVDPFIELTMTESERKAQQGEWVTPGGGMAFYAKGPNVMRTVIAPRRSDDDAKGDEAKVQSRVDDMLKELRMSERQLEKDIQNRMDNVYGVDDKETQMLREGIKRDGEKRLDQLRQQWVEDYLSSGLPEDRLPSRVRSIVANIRKAEQRQNRVFGGITPGELRGSASPTQTAPPAAQRNTGAPQPVSSGAGTAAPRRPHPASNQGDAPQVEQLPDRFGLSEPVRSAIGWHSNVITKQDIQQLSDSELDHMVRSMMARLQDNTGVGPEERRLLLAMSMDLQRRWRERREEEERQPRQ